MNKEEFKRRLQQGETWADLVLASARSNGYTLFILFVVGVFAIIGISTVIKAIF